MELPPELFLKQYDSKKESPEKKQSNTSVPQEKKPLIWCRTCGVEVDAEAKFCWCCGAKIDQASPGYTAVNTVRDSREGYFRAQSNASEEKKAAIPTPIVDRSPYNQKQTEQSSKDAPLKETISHTSRQTQPDDTKKSDNSGFIIKAVAAVALLFLASTFLIFLFSKTTVNTVYYTPASPKNEAQEYLDIAKEQLEKRDYNGALGSILTCYKQYPETEVASSCEDLYTQLYLKVKDNEPENGQTLERTFQYMGGCVFRVTAESGPALITISDKNDPAAFARFYVRKGETAEINVTGGTYKVNYQIGYLWLDNTIGFGDFYKNSAFEDDLVFKSESFSGWVSHDTIEVTV